MSRLGTKNNDAQYGRSVRKNGVFHARFNPSVLSRVRLSNFATKKRPWVIDPRNQQTADGWSEEHRSVKDYLTQGDGIGETGTGQQLLGIDWRPDYSKETKSRSH